MTDAASAVAVGAATSAATSAALSGLPPQEVIFWAFCGGLVSVWLSSRQVPVFNWKWVAGAISHVLVSAVSGIVLSAVLLAVAPNVPMITSAALVPRWASAGVIAALIHLVAPWLWKWLKREGPVRVSKNEG